MNEGGSENRFFTELFLPIFFTGPTAVRRPGKFTLFCNINDEFTAKFYVSGTPNGCENSSVHQCFLPQAQTFCLYLLLNTFS